MGVTISQDSQCYRRGEINRTLCDHDDDYNTWVKSSPAPTPAPGPTPAPKPSPYPPGFNDSPWKVGKPEDVGLKTADLDDAKNYINLQVLYRRCLLVVKDNTIVYEWYDPTAPLPPLTPAYAGDEKYRKVAGYSMTKTVGAYLIGYIAARVPSFDIDVGITETWKIPSPKPYEVTMRMMMSQTLGSDDRPGALFRYDELGSYWLWTFPMIIQAATGRNASDWMASMMLDMGIGPGQFTWDTVDKDWSKGAMGTSGRGHDSASCC
jgi:hypothetical protein